MKKKEVQKLRLGLYRIYWKEGNSSLAAVGNTCEGNRWLAPINWVYWENQHSCVVQHGRKIWKEVDYVERVGGES